MKAGTRVTAAALAIGLLVAPLAHAGEPIELTKGSFLDIDSLVIGAEGRPNEEARYAGLKAYVRGDHARAAGYFETAAFYADKYSQHALSLLHWHGVGVPVDRVRAYIWADLAAERGVKRLLLVRERMWQELTDAEREQAKAEGESYYARYGDEAAQPRAEATMRRFATTMTGSRLGFDGQPREAVGKPQAGSFIPQTGTNSGSYVMSSVATHDELYGHTRRDLAAYWKQQDRMLNGVGRAGELEQTSSPRR